ncbi:MAG: DUF58 domain-containing protein [Oligoflexus sp.]
MKFGSWKAKQSPYIIPSYSGVFYLLFIVMVFALGYIRDSIPFHTVGLTMIVFGLVAMIQSNQNMTELDATIVDVEFGEEEQQSPIHVKIHIRNLRDDQRYNLFLQLDRGFVQSSLPLIDVLTKTATCRLAIGCPKRGVYPIEKFKIASRGVYGLFYVWRWLASDARLLVYPKAEGSLPLPLPPAGQSARRALQEDFMGHRPYAPGASLRQVDWKAYARGQELLLKEFHDGGDGDLYLDLADIPLERLEARLRQASAWVFASHARQNGYSLKLGQDYLALNRGSDHLKRSLELLAAYKEA